MVFDSRKVEKSLKKKGFKNRDSHHKIFEFYYENKLVAWTKLSHNGQDIGDNLISAMSRQCKLTKNDFVDLIKCPLSQEVYTEKLEEQGLLS